MLYKSRESRPEDLEKIRELQREVKQQQHRLRELEVTTHTSKQTNKHAISLLVVYMQAEKQVYQLELVNREKNYNKLFSASPCVGVLDPLASSKVCP